MKKLNLILCAIVLLFIANNVKAQTGDPPTQKPGTSTMSISGSHMAAATDLLIAMDIPAQLGKMYDSAISNAMTAIPDEKKEAFKTVMVKFMNKYMSWEALKLDMSRIYAEELTESELKETIKFYQSPVGKKIASKLGTMQAKGMALGQQKVKDHMSELQADIEAIKN